MSLGAPGYPVHRSTGQCSASGRAFAAGESIVATLVERPDGAMADMERADYALEAWASGARPAPPMRVFAAWRTTFRPHETARRPILSDAELLELFEELGSAPGGLSDITPPDAASQVRGGAGTRQLIFRYVLALLLVRRRMLRLIGTRRIDGGSVLLVIPKGADATHPIEVIDPRMDDAAVQDAIEQLGRIIDTDALPAAPGGATEKSP